MKRLLSLLLCMGLFVACSDANNPSQVVNEAETDTNEGHFEGFSDENLEDLAN